MKKELEILETTAIELDKMKSTLNICINCLYDSGKEVQREGIAYILEGIVPNITMIIESIEEEIFCNHFENDNVQNITVEQQGVTA